VERYALPHPLALSMNSQGGEGGGEDTYLSRKVTRGTNKSTKQKHLLLEKIE
jgi:hypothetical protein